MQATPERVQLNPKHFRPNTHAFPKEVNFFFDDGGLGDYICWMAAILYVATECPHVHGHLYVPPHFFSLAVHFMKPHSHWTVGQPGEMFDASLPDRRPVRQPINATGANLLDLGFIYFAEAHQAPKEHRLYPKVRMEEIPKSDLAPSGPYVVLTAGASFENRQMTAEAFNGIKAHIIKRGFTPVIVGRSVMGKNDERKIMIHSGYDFSGTINLIDQTPDMLEVARIIDGAEMVVGLDNGLLHLAACTDTPVIFGYTIASPDHREPKPRGNQWIINVHPDLEKLSCTFCQSNMRHLYGHSFATCIYKDNACTKILTSNIWVGAMDKMLELIRMTT